MDESDLPPLCPECMYCRLGREAVPARYGVEYIPAPRRNRCRHVAAQRTDPDTLATGEPPLCADVRMPQGACGHEGKLFAVRPPPPPPPEPPPNRIVCQACGELPPSGRHNSWLCRIFAPMNERAMRKAEERRRSEAHRAAHPHPRGCQCPRCFGGAE